MSVVAEAVVVNVNVVVVVIVVVAVVVAVAVAVAVVVNVVIVKVVVVVAVAVVFGSFSREKKDPSFILPRKPIFLHNLMSKMMDCKVLGSKCMSKSRCNFFKIIYYSCKNISCVPENLTSFNLIWQFDFFD